jgi:hypothetical protein
MDEVNYIINKFNFNVLKRELESMKNGIKTAGFVSLYGNENGINYCYNMCNACNSEYCFSSNLINATNIMREEKLKMILDDKL